MTGKIKVMSIFGTRPEAIKMAPVVMELMRHADEIETRTLVTAQHREMLDQVLRLFHIVPDYDLNIMAAGQTLFDITTRAMMGINEVFQKDRPDLVLVHGDTTTTFAGALAAYYHQIPVGHVEAGLRTHDIYSPFPEEMNRRLTGGIATLHFAPTSTAHANLVAEGVPERRIFVTGNTVIDALHHTVRPDYVLPEGLAQVDFANHRVLLVTTHRRENLGEPMRHVYRAIHDIVDELDDVEVIFPVHRNPKVREIVREELGGSRTYISSTRLTMNRLRTSWPVLISCSRIQAAFRRRLPRSESRSSSCAIRRSVPRQLLRGRCASSGRTSSASTTRRCVSSPSRPHTRIWRRR